MLTLQERERRATAEVAQNPPEADGRDQKDDLVYTEQDQKILQLCGEGWIGMDGLVGMATAWQGWLVLPGSGWEPQGGVLAELAGGVRSYTMGRL